MVLLFGVAVAAGVLSGCAKAEEICEPISTCGRSIQTCCTNSACHYTVGGQRFDCNGTDCTSAAPQAARAACGKSEPEAVASLVGAAVQAQSAACDVLP